jgi:4-amino-4-deoxy-L-arabinose transferase-like glycosyltransferase
MFLAATSVFHGAMFLAIQRPRPEHTGSGRTSEWASLAPWFGLAVLLSFLLRLPFLNVGLISDEGGYAYVAQRWLDGRGTLYDDIWVSRPQGIFVAYAAIMKTVGSSAADLRFGAWLFVVATMPAVFAFARAYAGRRAAILALLIFSVLSASPAIEGFTANAEVFMALPCAIAAWLLLRAQQTGWRWQHLVLAGVLTSFATLLKPSGIVMLPVAGAFILLVGNGGVRAFISRVSWVVLGIAAGVAPALIHGYMVGWDNFVFASVTYRIDYQSSATVSWHQHVQSIIGLTFRVLPILAACVLTLLLRRRLSVHRPRLHLIGGGSQLAIAAGPVTRVRMAARRYPVELLLWMWMAACVVGIAMGGDWWFHYLIQIAAPFCIWLAPVLLEVGDRLRGIARTAFIVVICAVLLYPFAEAARGSTYEITAHLYPNQKYESQGQVADYIKEHADPDAPILVAFDSAALYYLSDHPAAYRYMYEAEMRAIPHAEQDLINLVTGDNRPQYVIDTSEGAPFADAGASFWDAVMQHYQIEIVINGFKIYRATN